MDERPRPPLSVVVSTTEPWPKLRPFLERVDAPLAELRGELVVCDGDGRGLPGDALPTACERIVLVEPGRSVFELRALGVSAATGEVVAVTEDHCFPEPDWCAELLAAHGAYPDAAAIGGAVLNGSTGSFVDWANFLMTFAEFLPPLPSKPMSRVPPAANLSFKRSVLPDGELVPGWLEFELLPRLAREGRVALAGGARVAHVQSHGALGTVAMHFHNGRSTAGLGRSGRGLPTRQEVQQRLRLPPELWRQTREAMRQRPELPARARMSVPLVAGLGLCHAAGELVGLLAGQGRSPAKLE